ncbi:MLP-like protein 43 [Silene latifolia]|uniref:MLP-like protein 43 n=1 Tax=Silene latifolia TaxID=37657 RepID=UPI003D77B208
MAASAGLLKRKLEGEVEIREGAADAFHDLFANRPHHLPNVKDDFIHACHLHEGAFGTPGSTIEWTYTVDGKKKTAKQIVEVVDEQNKVMKFKSIDGDLTKDYNYFAATFQVLPLTTGTCKVIWTLEYEKKEPGFPEPTAEMDALIKMAKEIDDHHHGVKN